MPQRHFGSCDRRALPRPHPAPPSPTRPNTTPAYKTVGPDTPSPRPLIHPHPPTGVAEHADLLQHEAPVARHAAPLQLVVQRPPHGLDAVRHAAQLILGGPAAQRMVVEGSRGCLHQAQKQQAVPALHDQRSSREHCAFRNVFQSSRPTSLPHLSPTPRPPPRTFHMALSLSSPMTLAAMAAPCMGGLEYMGRMTSLSWLSTRVATSLDLGAGACKGVGVCHVSFSSIHAPDNQLSMGIAASFGPAGVTNRAVGLYGKRLCPAMLPYLTPAPRRRCRRHTVNQALALASNVCNARRPATICPHDAPLHVHTAPAARPSLPRPTCTARSARPPSLRTAPCSWRTTAPAPAPDPTRQTGAGRRRPRPGRQRQSPASMREWGTSEARED